MNLARRGGGNQEKYPGDGELSRACFYCLLEEV